MTFDDAVLFLVYAFIGGALLSLGFRIAFSILNKKQSEKFLREMDEKMRVLNKDAFEKVGNLQESMDMITKEHSDMVNYIAERDHKMGVGAESAPPPTQRPPRNLTEQLEVDRKAKEVEGSSEQKSHPQDPPKKKPKKPKKK